jgi:glucuronate isomerase
MQCRFEALPPTKCSLIASDARCIEWCFGKVLLVKHLLAQFLAGQIAAGWLNRADALWVARSWLMDAPATLFAVPTSTRAASQ